MDTPNYPVHIDLEKLKRNNLVCDETSLIHQRQLGRLVQISFVILLMTIIVCLLAKEAKRCAETQIREVVAAAYYNFIDEST